MRRLLTIFLSLLLMHLSMSESVAGSPATAKTKSAQDGGLKPKGLAAKPQFDIEAIPAWVEAIRNRPVPTRTNDAQQLLLVDYQINLEEKQLNHFGHIERRINTAAGLETGSQIQIGFDPSYQKLVLHQLELVRAGKHLNKLTRDRVRLLQREPQLEALIYDGRMTASIVLDDVRVGDTVQYAYSLIGSNPVFDGKFSGEHAVFAENIPISLYQLRLLAAEKRNIVYNAPKAMQVQSKVYQGKRETVFRQSDIPPATEIEGAPASSWLENLVQLSEFANWNEVARWANGLFAKNMQKDPRIAAQAARFRAQSDNQEMQLQLALDFVQKEVRYFGTELGVNSHQPNPPGMILEQRFGDCKDKAGLLIALLRELGIAAQPVLVSTMYAEETDKLLASPLAFNHVIARVALADDLWWLDPTRSFQTGPVRERQSTTGKVLVVAADSSELVPLPDASSGVKKAVVDTFRFFPLTEKPVLQASITYHQSAAEYMRSFIAATPQAQVQTGVAKVYLQMYPKASLRGALKVDEVKGHNALQLTQEFTLNDWWEMPDFYTLQSELAFWSLKYELEYPQGEVRTRPYVVGTPGISRHTLIAEFDRDMLEPQKEDKFTTGQGSFSVVIKNSATPRRAVREAELRLNGRQVLPGQWASFTAKMNDIKAAWFPQLKARVIDSTTQTRLTNEIARMLLAHPEMDKDNPGTHVEIQQIFYNHLLESNQLNPDLRAKVLLGRADKLASQLHFDEAERDVNAAMQLATADDPAILSQALLLAFQMQKDQAANSYLQRLLDVAPHESTALQIKMRLDYHKGNYDGVKTTANQLIAQDGEQNGFYAIWRYLAEQKKGENGRANLQKQLAVVDPGHLSYPVIQFLLNKIDLPQLQQQADKSDWDDTEKCSVYFYTGEKLMMDGNLTMARTYWRKAVDFQVGNVLAYTSATRRLQDVASLPAGATKVVQSTPTPPLEKINQTNN